MQMPLCFPEKITSGPAVMVMGVITATLWCIGVKGVAKAGGMIPDRTRKKIHNVAKDMFFH